MSLYYDFMVAKGRFMMEAGQGFDGEVKQIGPDHWKLWVRALGREVYISYTTLEALHTTWDDLNAMVESMLAVLVAYHCHDVFKYQWDCNVSKRMKGGL